MNFWQALKSNYLPRDGSELRNCGRGDQIEDISPTLKSQPGDIAAGFDCRKTQVPKSGRHAGF